MPPRSVRFDSLSAPSRVAHVERPVPHCRECGVIPAPFGIGRPGLAHLYDEAQFHLCYECWTEHVEEERTRAA